MLGEKLGKTNYKTLERNKKPTVLKRLLHKNKFKKEHYSNAPLELEFQKALLSHLNNEQESFVKEVRGLSPLHNKEKSVEIQNQNIYNLSKEKLFLSSADLTEKHRYLSAYIASKSLNSGLNIKTTEELLSNWISSNVRKTTSLQNLLMLSKITPELSEIGDDCDSYLCGMCLSLLSSEEMYLLQNCGCKFCYICMQQYLMINILEGRIDVTCPDPLCDKTGKIYESEIEKLVGNEIYDKYKKFKLNAEIEKDPYRCWCPNLRCNTVCQVESPDIPIPVICPECNLMFCSACKEYWHPSKFCEDMKKKYNKYIKKSSSPFMMTSENVIKQCPGCSIPIERNEGCAQMKCRCCKHIFCWHCLSLLDDDILLRHFDKGPCKNKLGHSRASLMWHRVRVIITIIGLSALLATLSPLLLLSFPFILCCKCHLCKKLLR